MKHVLWFLAVSVLVVTLSISPAVFAVGIHAPGSSPLKLADATESWDSPEFGPVSLTYADLSGQQVAVTGTWSQPGGIGACTGTAPCIGQFSNGTYDRSSHTVALSYFQPWNNVSGQASLTLSSDGKVLTGTWQHSTGARGSWSMNRPAASVLSASPAPPANADDLGAVWTVCEGLGPAGGSCIAGTWTRQGNGSSFAATWRNGAVAALTITKSGNRVTVTRTDSAGSVSAGLTGTYQGTLSGNSINDGASSWRWANGDSASGWWKATVSGATPIAATPVPTVTPAPDDDRLDQEIGVTLSGPTEATAGTPIRYVVTATNTGKLAVGSVYLRLYLRNGSISSFQAPQGWTCESIQDPGGIVLPVPDPFLTVEGAVSAFKFVQCGPGSLNPGQNASLEVDVESSGAPQVIVRGGCASIPSYICGPLGEELWTEITD